MQNVRVFQSPTINKTDTIIYHGVKRVFSLTDKNETDGPLILIYMYCLPNFQDHGIKVGMAKCNMGEEFWHALYSRIHNQTHELALKDEWYEKYGLEREVIYWGICLDTNNDSFKDYHVHDEIKKDYAGIIEKEQEWFMGVPKDELIRIFNSLRQKDLDKEIYKPRKEQQECIDELTSYFKNNPKGRYLLNCKMRFGKSYTVYKYCEQQNFKKILILTFVPAVESSWKEDLLHIEKEYRYFTDDNLRKKGFDLTKINNSFVLFLSLQNYLGKEKEAGVKTRIQQLQDIDWDVVILDEYHFGAWNQKTQGTLKKIEEEKNEDLNDEYQSQLGKLKNPEDIIDKFHIHSNETICLSGTPFKALARGEFTDESSFTYSYFDEQRNKYPKSEENDFAIIDEKYAKFPDMRIYGYNMKRLFSNLTESIYTTDKLLGIASFSLNKFFETRQENNPSEPCTFIYEDEIKKWLYIIKGRSAFGTNFPYSNPDMLENNAHTLWLMPNVKACKAMEDLLLADEYFGRYEIINLSKDGVGSGRDACDYLMRKMTESENTNKLGSIAITVNKLTIGVTVKKWSSVFVLKDLASPEQYFQSIFRIQTPYYEKIGEKEDIKKHFGYVYDFNIDRACALLLNYAEQSEGEKVTKLQIARLIVKYLPIFYIKDDIEEKISEQVFYELAQFGDSNGIPLSKKITDTSRTTRRLDEETIAMMLNDKEVSEVLKNVFAHAKFVKPKTNTVPAKPEDGFDSVESRKGINKGHELGVQDYSNYVDYDDDKTQGEIEKAINDYIREYCPEEYSEKEVNLYSNGFTRGYWSGINVPIKKLNCGYDDGKKYVDVIKKKFGNEIKYTINTRSKINSFVNEYLNNINNVPQKYKGILYRRWYSESFKRAIKDALTPVVKIDKDNVQTVENVDNILRHILTRLFEFLYISVYRETTFNEIFANAKDSIFLEAVGITKKDFEILNRYKVFQEDVLNNYIHEFFVNESLGEKLNLEDEQIRKRYRNSFDWFGYGLGNENNLNLAPKNPVSEPVQETTKDSQNEPNNTKDNDRLSKEDNNSKSLEIQTVNKSFTLKEQIINLLSATNKMKASKIADKLGVPKKVINKILYKNKNTFEKDNLAYWKLKTG